jgi:hypothetical protein
LSNKSWKTILSLVVDICLTEAALTIGSPKGCATAATLKVSIRAKKLPFTKIFKLRKICFFILIVFSDKMVYGKAIDKQE